MNDRDLKTFNFQAAESLPAVLDSEQKPALLNGAPHECFLFPPYF